MKHHDFAERKSLWLFLFLSFSILISCSDEDLFSVGTTWKYTVKDNTRESIDTLKCEITDKVIFTKLRWSMSTRHKNGNETIMKTRTSELDYDADKDYLEIPNPMGLYLDDLGVFGRPAIDFSKLSDTIKTHHTIKQTSTGKDGTKVESINYIDSIYTDTSFGKTGNIYQITNVSIHNSQEYVSTYMFKEGIGFVKMEYRFPNNRMIELDLIDLNKVEK